jgi:hypothetical protein
MSLAAPNPTAGGYEPQKRVHGALGNWPKLAEAFCVWWMVKWLQAPHGSLFLVLASRLAIALQPARSLDVDVDADVEVEVFPLIVRVRH